MIALRAPCFYGEGKIGPTAWELSLGRKVCTTASSGHLDVEEPDFFKRSIKTLGSSDLQKLANLMARALARTVDCQ